MPDLMSEKGPWTTPSGFSSGCQQMVLMTLVTGPVARLWRMIRLSRGKTLWKL